MDFAQKTRIIDIISWGKLVFNNKFILYPATSEIKALSAIEYQKKFDECISDGMPDEQEAIDNCVLRNRWSEDKAVIIESIQKDIHTMKRGLLDYIFKKDKLEKIRKTIRSAENILIDKITEKHQLLTHTADNFALKEQQHHIIMSVVHDFNNNRLWPSKETFDNGFDTDLINDLCQFYFYSSKISQSVIREISRSEPWRYMWGIMKKSKIFFGQNNVNELSDNQRDLLYWSSIYDMAYDSYERPSDTIINDDDLLDSWFIRQSEKIESDTNKGIADNVMKKNNKNDNQEVFIFTDEEGAKDVYKLNDRGARIQIQSQQNILEKKKIVREQDLPNSQAKIRQQLMKMRSSHVKK